MNISINIIISNRFMSLHVLIEHNCEDVVFMCSVRNHRIVGDLNSRQFTEQTGTKRSSTSFLAAGNETWTRHKDYDYVVSIFGASNLLGEVWLMKIDELELTNWIIFKWSYYKVDICKCCWCTEVVVFQIKKNHKVTCFIYITHYYFLF